MANGSSDSKMTQIPFVFYDLIGRMMPGAYLIIGVVLCWLPFLPVDRLTAIVKSKEFLGMSGGLAAALLGLGLLVFGLTASFFGFLLAALSHVAVEECIWQQWKPFTRSGLAEFLAVQSLDELDRRFTEHFGALPTAGVDSLNRASFLCAYYIWRTDTSLGGMQGRFDADLLATQSFVLISFGLAIAVVLEILRYGCTHYFFLWLIALCSCGLAAGLAFDYHRKKRVYGRFGLFLAITTPRSGTPEVGHQGGSTSGSGA
ncbi:MAG: hypothetical protein WB995_03320 [Candidatus Acidiferrales bacterium]